MAKKKENKKVMAIAIQPELHEELKSYSKRRDESVSEYVGSLIEQALLLPIDEEPVILSAASKNKDQDFIVHNIKSTLHNELKSYVQQKEMTVSSFIEHLIAMAIKLPYDEDPMIIGKPNNNEVIPVVLKIPANLKGRLDDLRQWFEPQVNGIIKKLGE